MSKIDDLRRIIMKCKLCNNVISKNIKYCPNCGKKINSINNYIDFISIISFVFIILSLIGYIIINIYAFLSFRNQDVNLQSGFLIIFFISTIIFGIVSFYYIILFLINILLRKLENTAKIIKNIILIFLQIIPFILLIIFFARYF